MGFTATEEQTNGGETALGVDLALMNRFPFNEVGIASIVPN
jgi:hypothetical protein